MQFAFADHILDIERRELRRGAALIAVEPQVLDVLIYLITNRDCVVSKNELIASVWGGRIVSDATLSSRISAARRVIGDRGNEQKLIRTIARKGFRFVGSVCMPNRAEPATALSAAQIQERHRSALPPPDRPAIAVLPFTNLSSDRKLECFSDGICEDLTTALSKVRWFFVVARTSAFTYKGKAVHMGQVAAELGVGYVIEGSVRKSGDRVRITVELIDAVTGNHLWAERYDRELADVFAVQDEITQAIVAAVEPQLYAAENLRAKRKRPDSVDAWGLSMWALSHYWQVTRQDSLLAQALLEKAIAIDPNYSQALGALAASHTFSAHMGWADGAASAPIAERVARSALQADSEDPWAHYALGNAHLFKRRFDDSLAEFELALRLHPNFSLAHGSYAMTLAYCGRWREGDLAVRRVLHAGLHDPFSAIYCGVAAYAQFVGRNYQEAIRLSRQSLRQRADFVGAHRVLTAASAMAGQDDSAKLALQGLRRAQPNISLAWISSQLPIKQEADRDHYLEAFRRAGLD